ncbi:unnamed protein product [Caenorhabditis auriculariae]|uniref:Uncharacterized protein n=1 Tax=Caenorhabditis auriculariae TaxID=2777116 RepID=A0A8S1HTM2_9PELO|nr:unnamed protein product [Caenorhabditis auriculariae]
MDHHNTLFCQSERVPSHPSSAKYKRERTRGKRNTVCGVQNALSFLSLWKDRRSAALLPTVVPVSEVRAIDMDGGSGDFLAPSAVLNGFDHIEDRIVHRGYYPGFS